MLSKKDEEYLENKIKNSDNEIRFTYFEFRVKRNMSEIEAKQLLKIYQTKLENMGYKVYLEGEKFYYNGANRTVQSNELMIAVK